MLRIVVSIGHTFDRLIDVSSSHATIGRSKACGIWLPDPLVSRDHAALTKSRHGYCIRDLKSRNGTLLDGRRVGQAEEELHDGADVVVGKYHLKMWFGATPSHEGIANADDPTWPDDDAAGSVAIAMPATLKLTPAQRRVYSCFLEGRLEKEVAAALGISIHTVHWHAKAIYRLFAVSTRAELIAQWATQARNAQGLPTADEDTRVDPHPEPRRDGG